jgi:hypothetical protein
MNVQPSRRDDPSVSGQGSPVGVEGFGADMEDPIFARAWRTGRALGRALRANADVEVVRLVRGTWPDAIRAHYGNLRTPLHDAVLIRVPHGVVAELVQWRPEAISERDDEGNLPIHYLYLRWYHRLQGLQVDVDVARLLIEAWPGSLLEANDAGELPLHRAVQSDSLPLVRLLVEQNPQALHVGTAAGSAPLRCTLPDRRRRCTLPSRTRTFRRGRL